MQARKGYGAAMKKDTIDKLIDRIDHIKEEDLQRFFVKLAEPWGFFQQVFESIQEGLMLLLDSREKSCSSTRRRSSSSTRSPLHHAGGLLHLPGPRLLLEHGPAKPYRHFRDVEIFYPGTQILNIFIPPSAIKTRAT